MAAHPATPLPSSKTINEVRKLDQLFMRAVETRDLDTILSLYDTDATVLPPHFPAAVTQTQIRDLFDGLFAQGARDLRIETTRIEEGGNLVVATGTYTATIDQVADRGKFLAVFRRNKKGDLRLAFDTWNSDLPLPTA